MTDHLVSPDYSVTLVGTVYQLSPSLKTLKTIQHKFAKDILQLQTDVFTMSFDNLAVILSIGIEGAGATPPAPDVIEQEIVDELGILQSRFLISEWLVVATTPKRDRQKKAKEMAKLRKTLEF